MLILTRKLGQSIMIGQNIEIMITAVEGEQIKIGIEAPAEVNILRKEVFEAVQQSNKDAARAKVDLEQFKKMVQSPPKPTESKDEE